MRTSGPNREFYFWDPEFCWEILRRCPSYQNAFLRFQKEAKETKDYASLQLASSFYTMKDALRSDTIEWDFEPASKRKQEAIKSISSDEFVRWIEQKKLQRTKSGQSAYLFDRIFQTPYIHRFQKKFGDVLAFPIPPDIQFPQKAMMLSVWRMTPIRRPLAGVAEEKLEVSLNFSFSDAAIARSLAALVAERRKQTDVRTAC